MLSLASSTISFPIRPNEPFRFVVRVIAACTQNAPFALVMELMSGGTLSKLLLSEQELSWQVRLTIAEEIAEGIKALHSHVPLVCSTYLVLHFNST